MKEPVMSVQLACDETPIGFLVSTVELLLHALPIHSKLKGERCWETAVFDSAGKRIDEQRASDVVEAMKNHQAMALHYSRLP